MRQRLPDGPLPEARARQVRWPGAGNEDVTGEATFGFVSKYKKGASVPTGNTQFQFKTGDLNFNSTSYDFLVVNQGGTNAMYQRTGTINGVGEYKFKIWATEGDGGPDTFQIKIWGKTGSGDVVIYDNGLNQTLGGGQIQVHTDFLRTRRRAP